MQLHHLITYLETIAPLNLQENYDNAGLITGHPSMEISGVIVCLDAIEAVIDEAIDKGCNIVVAHHPIVFRGLKKVNGNSYIERTIIKAIKNDIAIYAIHTNLDNVYNHGVNSKIMNRLGVTNYEILSPKLMPIEIDQPIGAGMVGYLSQPMSAQEFLNHIKTSMELVVLKHTQICREMISKVAVCGGSGSFLLGAAISAKADVFITADYKYHEFFDADGQIVIIDIGHYESEKYTIDLLYGLIINKFSTFATHCTKIITNPVNFYL